MLNHVIQNWIVEYLIAALVSRTEWGASFAWAFKLIFLSPLNERMARERESKDCSSQVAPSQPDSRQTFEEEEWSF